MCKGLREFKEKSGLSSYTTAEEVQTSWENLAAAIVIQAADDYRDALVTIKHYRWGDPVEELEYAKTVKTSCERFFCSDYAKLLTAADPVYIMERIKRESEEYLYGEKAPLEML